MNMGLFCVPENVPRREVLRKGDIRFSITRQLFDAMLGILQHLSGFHPHIMWGSVKMMLEKEKAYEPRYERLEAGNLVYDARKAVLKQVKELKSYMPKQFDDGRPGIRSAHQAMSQMLGMGFFYLTVIQDEGISEIFSDISQYCEANVQVLPTTPQPHCHPVQPQVLLFIHDITCVPACMPPSPCICNAIPYTWHHYSMTRMLTLSSAFCPSSVFPNHSYRTWQWTWTC